MDMILVFFFYMLIPMVIAYFLIYFAIKNAIVDANRELASQKSSATYRALE